MAVRGGVMRRVTVALIVAGLLGASCAHDGGSEGSRSPRPSSSAGSAVVHAGYFNRAEDVPEPVAGGVLRYSAAFPILSFDPVDSQGAGSAGNIEMAAVFGVLMRYNPTSRDFEPQMAESLTGSDDSKTWTLKLRPNIRFADGTSLNADAVVFNLKRHVTSKSAYSPLVELIDGYETPDPLTVVMRLKQPWRRFPYLLTTAVGFMVSPAAIQKPGGDVKVKPVGAGPFKVAELVPGEKVELVRNTEFWGGEVYLDRIVVSSVKTGEATLTRLETGQVDMIFLLDPQSIRRSVSGGYVGYVAAQYAYGLEINSREGRPTHDPRLRRAISAAIDRQKLNARVDDGAGLYSAALFPDMSRWSTGGAAPGYDPGLAKRLVDQVKSETGWDGSLSYLDASQNPPELSLTVEAMLTAVGFDVDLRRVPSFNDLIRKVIVDHDFDIVNWSISLWDAAPWTKLLEDFYTGSGRNSSGYSNRKLDPLIDKLGAAPSFEAAKLVMHDIKNLFTEDVPFVPTRVSPNTVVWAKDVHGLTPRVHHRIVRAV